jgi:hypothetical protein
MSVPRRVLLLAGILTIDPSIPALAQTRDATTSGWARNYEDNINYEGITRAERAAAFATLAEIERIFWRIPEIAHPKEFVVKVDYFGGSREEWLRNSVASYRVRFWFFGRMGPTRQQVASHGCTCIEVVINDTPTGGEHRLDGRPIIIEPNPGPAVPGAFATRGEGIHESEKAGFVSATFTRGGVSPWQPVSREAYLRALIEKAEGPSGEKPAEMRKALEKTPYEQWMADAPVRRRDREAVAAQLRGIQTPEQIAKFIKDQEDVERQLGEQLKASEPADRQRNAETARRASAYGDGLRAQIEAMSPGERAQPARATLDGVIRPVGPTDGNAVLTPKPGSWEVRRSPVEVHTITVSMGGYTGDTLAAPETIKAIRETFRKLDWAAIKALVDNAR